MPTSHHILFSVSSLGLGHATRTLPIIRYFLDNGWRVSVLAHGNALRFLEQELTTQNILFIEREDYPKLERGTGLAFFLYLLIDMVRTTLLIRGERKFILQCQDQYDCIIADGRYGICSEVIPSFLVSHQISFIMPRGLGLLRPLVDRINHYYFQKFDSVFIPDFPEIENCLAGRLSHNRITDRLNHQWVGLLSSYTVEEVADCDTIDYLFIISGYLQQQKESFTGELLVQAGKLPGHKVFILGDTSGKDIIRMEEEDITIYPVAVGSLRNTLFNRAKLILSRSGYTTILDLAEMDKPAVLFATPRQTEQEYLADFLGEKGWYATSHKQVAFDLQSLLTRAIESAPYTPPWKTSHSLDIIKNCIASYLPQHRFTFVVPAHNEEGYLEETLEHLMQLKYPTKLYEVIVVENGSTDGTPEICSRFAEQYENIGSLTSVQGVSRARNTGFAKADPSSDWIIFLDADTLLEKRFLSEVNRYLGKQQKTNPTVGTTSILPTGSVSAWAKFWFKIYDLGHRLTKTSSSLQIVRRQVAEKIQYDEQLNYAEDLQYLKEAGKHGNFFFLQTRTVSSSTRRFQQQGYLKQTFLWLYQALQPDCMKKKRTYEVIR
jgi:UDP-N-acetylglucosamine transferase subunit ALG13